MKPLRSVLLFLGIILALGLWLVVLKLLPEPISSQAFVGGMVFGLLFWPLAAGIPAFFWVLNEEDSQDNGQQAKQPKGDGASFAVGRDGKLSSSRLPLQQLLGPRLATE